MSTDISLGWTKEGTSGIVLDANDQMLLSRGVCAVTGGYYFPNLAGASWVFAGSSAVSASYTATGGVFGKGITAAGTFNPGSIAGVNIPANSDFTLRGWFNATSATLFFDLQNILATGTNKCIGMILTPEGSLYVILHPTTSTTGTTLISVSIGTGFHYISLIKSGMVLSLYVDGVLKGSYTLPSLTAAAIPVKLINSFYGGGTNIQFADMQQSKVARDGSFIPGNLFGY